MRAFTVTALLLAGGAMCAAQVEISEFPVPTRGGMPAQITQGPDQNVWFVESFANKIGRITASGVVTEFPIPTPQGGPGGITAGPDGNVWFTETSGNKIGRITPSGDITEFPVPTANSTPMGITSGPDGNLWFAEFGSVNYTSINNSPHMIVVDGKIGKITTSGVITEFRIPVQPGTGPSVITAAADGNLWYINTGKMGRITTSGAVTQFAGFGGIAGGITAGPDGNVWFAVGNQIGRVTTSGVITFFPTHNLNAVAEGISAGPDGALWYVEWGATSKIGRIATSGEITEFPIPTADGQALWITAGADGNLWFTETVGNKIGKITLPGQPVVGPVPPVSQTDTVAVALPKNTTVTSLEIQLDGSGSVSADAKPLKFLWTIPQGSPLAAISGATTATPNVQFTQGDATYTFLLTVTDSAGRSSTDVATVNYYGR